jgi:hypothetical protein
MKALLAVMLVVVPTILHAEESLEDAKERLRLLELERNDYRRPDHGTLPNDKEAERQQLIGFLFLRDPVWKLQQELKAQIDAVVAFKDSQDAMVNLDYLKEALAISEALADEEPSMINKACDQIRVSVLRRDKGELTAILEKYK